MLHDSDGLYLYHSVTQEAAFLCEDGRIEIRASPSGQAGSVVCAEGSGFDKSVQELLKVRLLEDESGVRFLFDESAHEVRRLADMQQAHSFVYLKASFTLQELFVSVKVYKFEMHRDGAFVFWCLRDLQRALSLSIAYARGGHECALGLGPFPIMVDSIGRPRLRPSPLDEGPGSARRSHRRQVLVRPLSVDLWVVGVAPPWRQRQPGPTRSPEVHRMVHPAMALSDWNSTPTATLEVKKGMVVDAQGFAGADPRLGRARGGFGRGLACEPNPLA